MAKKGSSWNDLPDSPNQSKYDQEIDRFAFVDGEWTAIRLLGEVFSLHIHWMPTFKRNDSVTAYPILCLKNEEGQHYCPLCEAGIKRQTVYLTNAIIRDLQDQKPSRVKVPDQKFRKAGDKWWSPVRVVQFPYQVAQNIKNISQLNKVKTKKGIISVGFEHPKHGRDLSILLDKNQTGSGMYQIQKEDKVPLTEEEINYLLYDISTVYKYILSEDALISELRAAYDKDALNSENCDIKEVKKIIRGLKDNDDDDDDVEDRKNKKNKKKNKPVKKREDDDEDLDDVEDEKTTRKSKKSSKAKKEIEDDLDDDLEDDDLDDDLEDDDLDDEDDEDEDLDDEEDDEPKKKKSKQSKNFKSRNKKEDDEDDDLEDEDLDEDEEEERPRKKNSSKEKSRRKK